MTEQNDYCYDCANTGFLAIIHPYIFTLCLFILFCGSVYSGIIAPIWLLFRDDSLYAESTQLTMRIFAFCVALGFFIVIIMGSLIEKDNIFIFFWHVANYWVEHPKLSPNRPTIMFTYALLIWNQCLSFFFLCFVNWKPSIRENIGELAPESHVFLIVAHNSSQTGLEQTLIALLKLVRPHQIYVADNGSTVEEQIRTAKLCRKLSNMCANDTDTIRSFVHVSHLSCGNKTLAQYAAVFHLNKLCDEREHPVKYITIIDDDVIVPTEWNYMSVEKIFQDQTKIAIAYPLCVANVDISMITVYQDCEYLFGDCTRFGWNCLGNQPFASGGMATWIVKPFLKVLERHCTCFHGEDLEMGYIVHKLSDDKHTEKLDCDFEARFGFIQDCIIPTAVPICFFHWFDFIHGTIRDYFKIPHHCGICGEHSFFNQRVRSWDTANHSFFWKYMQILFSTRGVRNKPKMLIRFICFLKIIGILVDVYIFISWFLVIYRGIIGEMTAENFGVFFCECVLITWACYYVYLCVVSYKLSKIGKAFHPEVNFGVSLMLIFIYMFVNGFCSVMYSLTYYLWKPFPKQIKEQLREDINLCKELHECWERSETVENLMIV